MQAEVAQNSDISWKNSYEAPVVSAPKEAATGQLSGILALCEGCVSC